jgi:hypothetical protein
MHVHLRLQHSLPRVRLALSETAQVAAGMFGLVFPRRQPLRALMSLGVLALSVSWLDWADEVSPRLSISCFLLIFGLRHAYLFATFKPYGIASWLKARWGSEPAFSLHESLLASLLFAQRLSFLEELYVTSHAPTGLFQTLLVSAGALMLVVGLVLSIWATRVIGLDTYHAL